jgi:hypothetical protein
VTVLLAINGMPDDNISRTLLALHTGLGFIELGAPWNN